MPFVYSQGTMPPHIRFVQKKGRKVPVAADRMALRSSRKSSQVQSSAGRSSPAVSRACREKNMFAALKLSGSWKRLP